MDNLGTTALRILQSLGGGSLFALYDYFQHLKDAGVSILSAEALIAFVIGTIGVAGLGWVLAKLGVQRPA